MYIYIWCPMCIYKYIWYEILPSYKTDFFKKALKNKDPVMEPIKISWWQCHVRRFVSVAQLLRLWRNGIGPISCRDNCGLGANSGVKNFNLKVSRDKHPNVLFERVPYIKNWMGPNPNGPPKLLSSYWILRLRGPLNVGPVGVCLGYRVLGGSSQLLSG